MADTSSELTATVRVPLSAKALAAIFSGLFVVAGSVPVVYFLNPPGQTVDAPDRFTGTEGKEHRKDIDQNATDIRAIRLWIQNHVEWGRKLAIEQSGRDAKQDAQIDELMRHHNTYHKDGGH